MNLSNDDFFSPVRQVTSDSDSSDDSENFSNFPIVTFTKSSKNKSALDYNETKCSKETNELESFSSESSFASKKPEEKVCTPVSKRNSNRSRGNSKGKASNFNKMKSEEKGFKDNVLKRESCAKSSEGHPKKQDYQQGKSNADCDAMKSRSKQNIKKGSSRPTSLSLSKKEAPKCSDTKDIKKVKNVNQSSKNMCNSDVLISNAKHVDKKLMVKSFEARDKNCEDFGEKSTDSNSCKSSILGSSNKKSDTSNDISDTVQNAENSKSTSNVPTHTPFEVSVEKIVHDFISSECDKIRQNVYAQNMSVYRELNRVKKEMKRQHLADTEHMFKIIEELMQMNFSLKSAS